MKTGWFRGHPVVWKNEEGVYAYDFKPLPATGGEVRPCNKCGKLYPIEKCDPCLGLLPGVNNACCGHGVKSESYIRFNSGVVVTNFDIGYLERFEGDTKEQMLIDSYGAKEDSENDA